MSEPAKVVKIKPIEEVRQALTRMTSEFEKTLSKQISPEKFVRVAMTAIQGNPDLLDVSRQSLYAEIMKCAQDSLLPDSREAVILVYRTKAGKVAKFLPMTAGILKKVRNSGDLQNINADIVFKNDTFDYWVDEKGQHLMHRPCLESNKGDRLLTYAVATTKSGGTYIEIINEEQMMAVKNISKAKDSGPWAGDFADEMRKKTAIRRLSKRLPMSTDIESLIKADDDLYEFKDEPIKKQIAQKTPRLAKLIAAEATSSAEKKQDEAEVESLNNSSSEEIGKELEIKF